MLNILIIQIMQGLFQVLSQKTYSERLSEKLLYYPVLMSIIEGTITIFNSRSDLPADIRYKSEIKEAYCDQRD